MFFNPDLLSLYIYLQNITNRAQSQMKMLRRVKNEIFTFDFDSEITLVDCTLER